MAGAVVLPKVKGVFADVGGDGAAAELNDDPAPKLGVAPPLADPKDKPANGLEAGAEGAGGAVDDEPKGELELAAGVEPNEKPAKGDLAAGVDEAPVLGAALGAGPPKEKPAKAGLGALEAGVGWRIRLIQA